MSRRSITFTVGTALAALVVLFGSAGDAAATDPIPVASPPVPAQDAKKVQAAAIAASSPATDFVPIAPCVIVDTRHGNSANKTKLKNKTSRSYAVAGGSDQGGDAAGCGVPTIAQAVALTAVVVSPSKKGSLKIWAAGAAEPTATFLNYGSFTMSGNGVVAVRAGTTPGLTVKNFTATTNLVLSVSGYYLPKLAGMVAPNGTIYAGSSGIVSAVNNSPGVFTVTFDRTITYCTPMVDTYNAGSGVYGAAYAFGSNTATVFTWYLSSSTHLEVPYSFYFYITVTC
ncbi:MAG: hypothetical protein QM779_09940 [Propionicimonas sp.]|uniref:hypothetical protein n=1 Tax=Propionicimonas sp. TaxID=1955623 RepID=UPI003D12D6AF